MSDYFLTATEMDAAFVAKALFNDNTLLASNLDNLPAALAMAQETIAGRLPDGQIAALTAAEAVQVLSRSDVVTAVDVILKATGNRQIVRFSSSPIITLPLAADYARSEFLIINTGFSTGTVVPAGTDTINGLPGAVSIGPDRGAMVFKRRTATDWIVPDILLASFSREALTFDEIDEYATIGDVSELSFERTDAFSIEAWFKVEWADYDVFFSKINQGIGNGPGLTLENYRNVANSSIVFWFKGDAPYPNVLFVAHSYATGLWVDGLWHHLMWTYDGSSNAAGVNLYIDNISKALNIGQNNLTASTLNTDDALIGARNAGAAKEWFFGGSMAQVTAWDIELTAGNVAKRYNGGTVLDSREGEGAANLAAYYTIDGDTIPTLTDRSGNGNDATTTNMDSSNIVRDSP